MKSTQSFPLRLFNFATMSYIQLTVFANQYQQEELIALLSDYNPTGFEERENELVAYFNEGDYQEETIEKIVDGFDYQLGKVEQKNWNEEWEKNFAPVVVGKFCAIRAEFHDPIGDVEHEIVITPKMSFGTGHHATTYQMIEQMKDIDFSDKDAFDFGTGTGILAILAEKLGANKITAIDVDEWSIENAKENINNNGCKKIDISLSSEVPDQQFDLILANINRNVILEHSEQLINCLGPKGLLLVSGILNSDEPDITLNFTNRAMRLLKRTEKDKWLSLLFVK